MSITTTPKWSLGRGKTVVPSSWQATFSLLQKDVLDRKRWTSRDELRPAIVVWSGSNGPTAAGDDKTHLAD